MNKSELLQQILARLEADRAIAAAALKAAHDAATHAESKAENKYDTRGLEAAYLADGQRRRLHEIELALAAFRKQSPAPCEGPVRVGALVLLDGATGERWVYLGPDGAGLKLQQEGCEVLVISPRSPLGQTLLGREAGDALQLQVSGPVQHYEIVEIH